MDQPIPANTSQTKADLGKSIEFRDIKELLRINEAYEGLAYSNTYDMNL